jgi:protein-S-isoprenylcysteine O-methyltransferase Ste14
MPADDRLFRLILIGSALAIFPIAIYFRVRSQATGESLDRRQEGLVILLTLRPVGLAHMFGLFTFMFDPARMAWASIPLPGWLRWAGVGIGVLGGCLLVWTLRTLGPNLTDTVVTRKAHTLVTSGPYRYVRHPFYGGAALATLANGLAAANWFLLVTSALVIVLFAIRTRTEEQKLIDRFGESYRVYMARTGRFLPRPG